MATRNKLNNIERMQRLKKQIADLYTAYINEYNRRAAGLEQASQASQQASAAAISAATIKPKSSPKGIKKFYAKFKRLARRSKKRKSKTKQPESQQEQKEAYEIEHPLVLESFTNILSAKTPGHVASFTQSLMKGLKKALGSKQKESLIFKHLKNTYDHALNAMSDIERFQYLAGRKADDANTIKDWGRGNPDYYVNGNRFQDSGYAKGLQDILHAKTKHRKVSENAAKDIIESFININGIFEKAQTSGSPRPFTDFITNCAHQNGVFLPYSKLIEAFMLQGVIFSTSGKEPTANVRIGFFHDASQHPDAMGMKIEISFNGYRSLNDPEKIIQFDQDAMPTLVIEQQFQKQNGKLLDGAPKLHIKNGDASLNVMNLETSTMSKKSFKETFEQVLQSSIKDIQADPKYEKGRGMGTTPVFTR